jgi:fructose-bisphosphate aldolase class I
MKSIIKWKSSDNIEIEGILSVPENFDATKKYPLLVIVHGGLIPIIEPEIDIHSEDKKESEKVLKHEIFNKLSTLAKDTKLMFKLSIPTEDNFYSDLINDSHVVRIVALSGGYTRDEANEKLAHNNGLVASFSRALLQGLTVGQTDEEFNATLAASARAIYEASIT